MNLRIFSFAMIFGISSSAHASLPCLSRTGHEFVTSQAELDYFSGATPASKSDQTPVSFSVNEIDYVKVAYKCAIDLEKPETDRIEVTALLAREPRRCANLIVQSPPELGQSSLLFADLRSGEDRHEGQSPFSIYLPIAAGGGKAALSGVHVATAEYQFVRKLKPRGGLFEMRLFDREIFPSRMLVASEPLKLGEAGLPSAYITMTFEGSFRRKGNGEFGPSYDCALVSN